MILYSEGATKSQEDEANWILEALNVAYPGYPWVVRVTDGMFMISNLLFDPTWRMVCKHPQFGYSASAMKREVILNAGEWLERANLKRGRNNEDEITHFDGVPDKYQPDFKKDPVPVIVDESGNALRTEPMPQVKYG